MRELLAEEDIQALVGLSAECERAEAVDGRRRRRRHESFDLFAGGASSEADALSAVEDIMHAASEHRVVHVHREGQLQARLPHVLDRVLAAITAADASRWRLLVGRPASIRSAEVHTYRPGGGVTDPQHRDAGSLLTLSVLLTPPTSYEGAAFSFPGGEGADAATTLGDLARGDGVLFVSEKRHNVSTLVGGERQSFVLELWEGRTNVHNRHR